MHRHHHRDIPLQDSSEAHALTDFSEFDRDLDDYGTLLKINDKDLSQLQYRSSLVGRAAIPIPVVRW